eukprot:scaffold230928_cov36-Tisochrysis_lutea.AAC.2
MLAVKLGCCSPRGGYGCSPKLDMGKIGCGMWRAVKIVRWSEEAPTCRAAGRTLRLQGRGVGCRQSCRARCTRTAHDARGILCAASGG